MVPKTEPWGREYLEVRTRKRNQEKCTKDCKNRMIGGKSGGDMSQKPDENSVSRRECQILPLVQI